jgi:hypothetical protein
MEYFRSWWKGRESELNEKIGEEGTQLERALRIALARSDTWILQEPQLTRLLDLCSSEWCRTEVNAWIASARIPVSIALSPQSAGGWSYTVGQYGPGDEEWLRKKVLQFAEGTAFKVQRWESKSQVPGLREARERIIEIIRASGRRLAEGV